MSFYDLSKKHGDRFIRVMKWAKEYRQSHLENKFKRVFRDMKVYYIYGSAGCSKTSFVFNKHGYDDVYRTTNYEFGWIEDYNGEKILFLDEFRSSFKISEIFDYLDGQPIRIRGRHYNRVACYDTVYIVSNLSVQSASSGLSERFKKRRKEKGLSQRKIASLSGVSYSSLRRFEATGEIALRSLMELARVLGCLEDFNGLFAPPIVTDLRDYQND